MGNDTLQASKMEAINFNENTLKQYIRRNWQNHIPKGTLKHSLSILNKGTKTRIRYREFEQIIRALMKRYTEICPVQRESPFFSHIHGKNPQDLIIY